MSLSNFFVVALIIWITDFTGVFLVVHGDVHIDGGVRVHDVRVGTAIADHVEPSGR